MIVLLLEESGRSPIHMSQIAHSLMSESPPRHSRMPGQTPLYHRYMPQMLGIVMLTFNRSRSAGPGFRSLPASPSLSLLNSFVCLICTGLSRHTSGSYVRHNHGSSAKAFGLRAGLICGCAVASLGI